MSPRVSTRLLARQSDSRLLELLSQGHERAFEAIVLRYRGELLSYCHRLGLSEPRAEDALQHALLKAWLALQGGTEVRELRAWLYRIVHNTAVNVMRSSPEERALDLDAALLEAATVPESELERTTAAREALTHVAALPSMQRHAMLLSAVEGRSHEEVASALGITDVAVRGLLYRARVTLRAAAAAFTPAPLVGWASQAAVRFGERAGAVAQFASGPPAAGGVLLRGAALAATAALAAGAVLGPLRSHHSHHAKARAVARLSAGRGTASESARLLATEQSSTAAAPSRTLGPRGSLHSVSRPLTTGVPRSAGNVLGPRRSQPVSLPRGGSSSGGSLPISPTDSSSPVSTPVKATGAAGSSAGDGGGEAGAAPPSGGSGGEGSGPVGGGAPEGDPKGEGTHSEHEEELAGEQAEHEREAAHEKAEKEAEEAREQAEREAEAAREQREAKADASP